METNNVVDTRLMRNSFVETEDRDKPRRAFRSQRSAIQWLIRNGYRKVYNSKPRAVRSLTDGLNYLHTDYRRGCYEESRALLIVRVYG